MKTHNAIAKRFKITKKGKILKRAAGQDHFNARENGNTVRKKRRDRQVGPTVEKNIKRLVQSKY